MRFITIQPPASLAAHVRYYWVLESEEGYLHHSMASGCPELVFHYDGPFDEILEDNKTEKSFTAGIHAQTNFSRQFITCKRFGIFGAFLFPYAIPELFGIAASEITNEMADLSSIAGAEGRQLEEQMTLAGNDQKRCSTLSAFLEKRLLKSSQQYPPVFSVINEIIREKGMNNLSVLAGQAYLSTRQFERRFKYYAGLSPKLFSRINRFHYALEQYGSKKSLTHIAYQCGYYDQSHFIRDFKEFSGKHPKQFFSGNVSGNDWRDL